MLRLISIILLSFLIGCSSAVTASAPEGVRQDFYNHATDVLSILDKKMESASELKNNERQKIEKFFQDNKPESTNEIIIYNSLSIIYPAFQTNIIANKNNDADGRKTSLKIYSEEYEKLSEVLSIK